MSMLDGLIKSAMTGHLPEADINYCWNIAWQYEEDNKPAPSEFIHATPNEALNHMIAIWNDTRTLIHVSVSRRNA